MIEELIKLSDKARENAKVWPPVASRFMVLCLWALVVIGIVSRLSPLFDIEDRLFWQFMTEDGYLMQTVARNMALGLGMSTAGGTLPTNGVQPLATISFATLHFLGDGSRVAGIALVTIFSTLVAVAAAICLYRVAVRVFLELPNGHELALLSAIFWFAAPKVIDHGMNGLETGVYYLVILCTLLYYLVVIADGGRPFTWRQRLQLGVLLGITFLARNDAVFFIAGLLFSHLALGGTHAGNGYRHRLADCLVAGSTSIVVGSPWLVNNYALFGSIVPISGLAESFGIHFAQNLAHIPANLFEAAVLFAPVPESLVTSFPMQLMSITTVVIVLAGFWLLIAKFALPARRFFVTGLAFMAGLSIYYGLFFGVAFFVPRYLSALSPFLWLATTATILLLLRALFRDTSRLQFATLAITVVFIVEATAFAWKDFSRGHSHLHKQVVEWVQANVADDQWVGAIQTGTLGFFHDRTINLDGKVNPEALRARQREGHVLNYIIDSRINYLADWVGITSWVTRKESPRFPKLFEIVVRDEQRNLGVLRRVKPVE